MTLTELKNYIESVCLAHKEINQFEIGSDFNLAENIRIKYPSVFYELPYFLTYNITPARNVDNVQFAFNVFVESNTDKILNDHEAISRAKEIGDQIVTYIQNNTFDFKINNVTGVSVREYTDDSVAGMRYEWSISLPRTNCDAVDLNQYFNPIR